LEKAMLDSATIEMIDHWRWKKELEAHNRLEELRKPDDLNDLIMTRVNLLVEKLSTRHDTTELRGDIATLIELLQQRKSRSELQRRQARL
jgi:hypothetical protein